MTAEEVNHFLAQTPARTKGTPHFLRSINDKGKCQFLVLTFLPSTGTIVIYSKYSLDQKCVCTVQSIRIMGFPYVRI